MGGFEILAQRLKLLRTKLGLTQKEFADTVGFTQATLSAYENNQKKPSLDIVKDIAEKCHVSIDWLCGLTEKESYNDEIETYADILRLYEKLCSIQFELDTIDPGFLTSDKVGSFFFTRNSEKLVCLLATQEDHICKFVKEWIEIRSLLAKNTIKQDLYDLWLNDKYKEYNIAIEKVLPFD